MNAEGGTDPRARMHIPAGRAPFAIAEIRTAAGEIRIAADALAREAGSGPVFAQAHALRVNAMRLGQMASLLSAVPLGEVALLHLPPSLPWRVRARAAWLVLVGR
jgi:hypothetical protein